MKIISFYYCLLLSFGLMAQSTISVLEQQFSVVQLQEDLAVLRSNLEKYQPDLYRYTPKAEMDQAFEQIKASIDKPMNSVDFLAKLMAILPAIGNGHTEIAASVAYYQERKESLKRLPLQFHWYENQLYLLRNFSAEEGLTSGLIVKSINGESAVALFQEFVNHSTRDGYNTSLPENTASVGFSGFYGIFRGHHDWYELETQTSAGSSPVSWRIAGLNQDKIKAHRKARYGAPPLSWQKQGLPGMDLKVNGEVATLTIRSFDSAALKKKRPGTKKQFKQFFEQIAAAGAEHLIIDLRDNGGGDPAPTEQLFSHLHPAPFLFYKSITANVKKIPKKENYTNVGWGQRFLHRLAFKKEGDQIIGKKIIPGLKLTQPAKQQFAGKVYVLTSPFSFSATGEMTGIIKNHDRAIFIGEEAGGNPVQNTSGLQAILELPHSKNRIIVPFWLWVMNVEMENTGRGVIPDHIVRPEASHLLEGKDRVMEFTMDLIKQSE